MQAQSLFSRLFRHSTATSPKPHRPAPRKIGYEQLEPRLLLYAANGGVWPHPELVTVSFMPDGTDVGGVPSNLISTLNQRWSTSTWQKEILRGLQSFAEHAKVNFSIVTDDGSPLGSAGGSGSDNNMQGDSNFGDIRIGGFNLGGPLGLAMLPPQINRDTTAGDFFLNTTSQWNIGTSFDLFTVAAHEAGHSIGLDHSLVTTSVMYDVYNGVKSSLTADDISGIQSVYGVRQADSFEGSNGNNTKGNASVITSYIDSNKQVTLSSLDLTSDADVDWYKITTPSGNSGTMTVRVQSSGLSLLAPRIEVYKGSTLKAAVSGSHNSVVTYSAAIGNGQNWFVKVDGSESGAFGTGVYALQINMGSAALPAVPTPNTATPSTGLGGVSSAVDGGFGETFEVDPSYQLASSTTTTLAMPADDDEGEEQENRKAPAKNTTQLRAPRRADAVVAANAAIDQAIAPHRGVSVATLDELLAAGALDAAISSALERAVRD